ncbi:MAG: cysteine desulfurase-like protein [Chloroflexota bacterium]
MFHVKHSVTFTIERNTLYQGKLLIDLTHVRSHFPALQRMHNQNPVIFFDNPAGTQVPRESMEGFTRYLESDNANVGGAFATSRATDALVEHAREAMADFLGAASPREIVFGQNMTSLTFQISHALGRLLRPGDEIVTTRLEHDANVAPWLALEERGVTVRWIDIHPEDGTLDMESAERAIGEKTRLVAMGYASNALGTINDVPRIGEMAHAYGAWLFVDAVHYAPHGPIDVQKIGCDLLVCSAYKFFGPHIGILYGRYDVLDALPAYHVRPAGDKPPRKWETGTQSHESLAALLGTLRYLESLSPEEDHNRTGRLHSTMSGIQAYERGLSNRLLPGMAAIPGLTLYGITDPAAFDRRVPTVSWISRGQDPTVSAQALGERGIFSWAGNHYAVEPLRRLGLDCTQRIGLAHYNTPEEIDRFLEALEALV